MNPEDDALMGLGQAIGELQDQDAALDAEQRAAFVGRAQEIPMIRRREMLASVTLGVTLCASAAVFLATRPVFIASVGAPVSTITSHDGPAPPEITVLDTTGIPPIQLGAPTPPRTRTLTLEPDSEPYTTVVTVPEPFNGPAPVVERPPNKAVPVGPHVEYVQSDQTQLASRYPVYMVGVYESIQRPRPLLLGDVEDVTVLRDFNRFRPVQVKLDVPGDVVLVLSAYEGLHWEVTVGAETVLREIVLNGYHTQRLTKLTHEGPLAGERLPTPLRTFSYDQESREHFSPFYRWTMDTSMLSTSAKKIRRMKEVLRPHLEAQEKAVSLIGGPIANFYGCYQMDAIEIAGIGAPRSHTCNTEAGYTLDHRHMAW